MIVQSEGKVYGDKVIVPRFLMKSDVFLTGVEINNFEVAYKGKETVKVSGGKGVDEKSFGYMCSIFGLMAIHQSHKILLSRKEVLESFGLKAPFRKPDVEKVVASLEGLLDIKIEAKSKVSMFKEISYDSITRMFCFRLRPVIAELFNNCPYMHFNIKHYREMTIHAKNIYRYVMARKYSSADCFTVRRSVLLKIFNQEEGVNTKHVNRKIKKVLTGMKFIHSFASKKTDGVTNYRFAFCAEQDVFKDVIEEVTKRNKKYSKPRQKKKSFEEMYDDKHFTI